ncbi:hypothetical protein KUH03_22120 [Sphingobacterium sp. E70]|uniref:hypothetical protein n=1 Tax=Sphingobacterium sp. E70 TaxID=2853439 RepID=UPI00211BA4FE|nr:hypothetical protein [Sphingobacterium sp. E70]ULT22177.1 hypothetical protein KUH03_22120 [Sphingobacterium sp. E70]
MKKYFILTAALCISYISYAQDFIAATYNIRQRNTVDTGNMWVDRKVPLTNLIKYHGFDIFGVQEAFHDQVQDLKRYFRDSIMSVWGVMTAHRRVSTRQFITTPIGSKP